MDCLKAVQFKDLETLDSIAIASGNKGKKVAFVVSGNINEGIKAVSFFKRKDFTHKKHKTHTSEQKQKKAAFLCAQKTSKVRKVACSHICVFVIFMLFVLICV